MATLIMSIEEHQVHIDMEVKEEVGSLMHSFDSSLLSQTSSLSSSSSLPTPSLFSSSPLPTFSPPPLYTKLFLSPQQERLAREEMIRQQNLAYQESLSADREKVGLAVLRDSTSVVYQCMYLLSCSAEAEEGGRATERAESKRGRRAETGERGM